jgi:hypothetical protein
MTNEKLKKDTSPHIDQIAAKLIKAGGSTIRYEINKLINSTGNREEMPEERMKSIIEPIYKKGDCSNYRAYHFYQLHTKCYRQSCCQG